MIGTPPATAASKPNSTPRRRAASNSSGPWVATSALLAVTTCLPAAIARRMNVRAGSSPPISSMTTEVAGSARTRSMSVVSGQSPEREPRPRRGDVAVGDGGDGQAAAGLGLEARPVLPVDLEHAAAHGPDAEEPDTDVAHEPRAAYPRAFLIPRTAWRIRCSFSTRAKRT